MNITHAEVQLGSVAVQKCRQKLLHHQKRKLSMLGPKQKRAGGTGTVKQLSGQDKLATGGGWLAEASASSQLKANSKLVKKLQQQNDSLKGELAAIATVADTQARVIVARNHSLITTGDWSARCRCVFVCCVFAL